MDKKHDENNAKYLSLDEYNEKPKANERSPFPLALIVICIAAILFFIMALISAFEEIDSEYAIFQYAGIGLLVSVLIVLILVHINSKTSNKTPLLLSKKNSEFIIVNELEDESEKTSIQTVKEIKTKKNITKKDKKLENVFATFAHTFNDYFRVKGYETKFGNEFISAMLYSRLIILKGEYDINVLRIIADIFDASSYIVSKEDYKDDSLKDDQGFMNFVRKAHKDKDHPHFIYINNIMAQDFTYLSEFKNYIVSPNENNVIDDALVPSNLWFIVTLNDRSSSFDIDRDLLKYAYVSTFDYFESGELERESTPINYSLLEISRILKRAEQKHLLSEDLWKKFDNLIKIPNNINEDYYIDNKIFVRLENFFVSYLECYSEVNQIESFDFALSRTILNDLLLEGSPNLFINQNDLFSYIEHNFEGIDLPNFEALIKSYFSLFDTEGNRYHE